MNNKKGFSLTELLVGIIVGSILVLTIGVLSSIAMSSFNKLNSQQQIYNDIAYGLKLIQNRVRNANAADINVTTKTDPPWVNHEQLVVGTEAFGLFQVSGSTRRDFIHLPNKSVEGDLSQKDDPNREVIFSVPNADLNLTWTLSSESVTVVLTGTKDKNPFHVETTVAVRNK